MADQVWLTDIYPAREAPIPGVDGQTLVAAATSAGAAGVRYVADLDSVAAEVAAETRPGDVILTLGAGSIDRTGVMLLEALRGEPVHA